MTRRAHIDKTQEWLLIIDDHPLFCDALELTFRSVLPGIAIKTADSLGKAKDLLEHSGPPTLVAQDLNLPDVTGVEGVIEVRRIVGDTPIIVVSSMTDQRVVAAVEAAGATGFVPKHSARGVFEEAITRIQSGHTYFFGQSSPSESLDAPGTLAAERLSTLTAQQAKILELICEGKLNKQIAFDLSIAETTVKAHITAIMRKLGVQSRTQAVLIAQNAKFSTILSESGN